MSFINRTVMSTLLVVLWGTSVSAQQATVELDRSVLPIPDRQYSGKAGRTIDKSTIDWPMLVGPKAPEDAPNVLLIITDDAGYGGPDTFGGGIRTPTLTRLAKMGLTYNRFHVTAVCSPTRAALLTGRNHHRVGMGGIAELPSPFPAPHHAPKEWADKYKGKFDAGWDKYREETLARQKKLGIVPQNTELTKRPDLFPAWDSLNEAEKKLYARQMEVFAGFSENTDWNIGRLLDAASRSARAP